MASYTYDETGHMALFFIITVLFMILVPVTLSQISLTPSKYSVPLNLPSEYHGVHSEPEIPSAACECSSCVDKRNRILKREKGTFFRPNITTKCVPCWSYHELCSDYLYRSFLIISGWVVFSLLAYRVATTKIENKIYDPFEILGIKSVSVDFKPALRHWL